MGNSINLEIPDNYKILKIISYNVRLIYNSPLRAYKIGYYLYETNNDLDNDIICLQGIYDNESIDIIKNILIKKYKNIYLIPENDVTRCTNIGILVFSKYKILNYKCKKFNENNNCITEYTGVIGLNILIKNTIISIYVTQLQSDYKYLVSNKKNRILQCKQIKSFIKNNIKHLNSNHYNSYKKSNIHLIVGSLNIPYNNLLKTTEEYTQIMDILNSVDIYKFIENDNKLITEDQNDYVLLYLLDSTDIIYTNKNSLIDQKYDKEILNKIFKYYNINFIDVTIKEFDYSDHYPMEIILLIKLI
jgi:hypothetical protein